MDKRTATIFLFFLSGQPLTPSHLVDCPLKNDFFAASLKKLCKKLKYNIFFGVGISYARFGQLLSRENLILLHKTNHFATVVNEMSMFELSHLSN